MAKITRHNTPGTSRVGRKAASSPRLSAPVKRGLARSAVVLERVDSKSWNVRVKGTRALVGTVRAHVGPKRRTYGFMSADGRFNRTGYGLQGAAVSALLERW